MSNKIIGNIVGIPNPITDYAQNDPAKADYVKNKPTYLTDFLKPIPKGKTVDELDSSEDVGCYILFNTNHRGYTGLLYVAYGIYSDNDNQADIPCIYQTRFILDANGFGMGAIVKIETRNNAHGWSEWKEEYATKEYVENLNERVIGIIDSAPEALNTLKELADALNNEPDFAANIVNQLNGKADKDYVDSEVQRTKNEIEETIEKYNIVSTSSGENINVTDGSKSSFRCMRIYGKTIQNGSPTYNLAIPLDSVGDEGSLNVNMGKKNTVSWYENADIKNLGINYIWEKGGSSLVINGTSTQAQNRPLKLEHQVMAPGVYTASVIGLNSSYKGNDTYDVICVDSGDVIAEGVMASYPKTFTIEEPTAIKLGLNINIGSSYDNQTVYFQIEPGEVATEYEPYEQPKTLVVDTPNGLPGIKLDSVSSIKNLANYTDSNGNKWICDVIDFEKGVYIQNIQQATVQISTGGTFEGAALDGYFYGVCTYKTKMQLAHTAALCEKAIYRPWNASILPTEGCFYENALNFVFVGSKNDTLDSLKSKYDGCKIMYVLSDPVITALSNEQIAAYKETISMYSPTTRYYNSENAGMGIDYVSDTKKYIDAKIDELRGDESIDIGTSSIIVDQTYNPESENAQSGKAVAQAISQIPTGGGDIVFSELANFTLEEEVNDITVPLSDDAFNYRAILIVIDTQTKATGQYWMRLGNIDNMKNTKKIISHMNGALDGPKHATYTMIDFFKNYCFSSAVDTTDYQYNSTPKQFMYPLVYKSFVANAINVGDMTFPVGTTIIVEGVM